MKCVLLLLLCLTTFTAVCRGDGNLQQYKNARIAVSVKDFGGLANDLLGSIKGSVINHVLSKKVDEKRHGVNVAPDGTETVVLNMYLSENGDHVVIRANKKPLFTMKMERFAKSTQTISTIFWTSKADKKLNKLCFKMHEPLPSTPRKVWARFLNFGAGKDGWNAKCSSQDSTKTCNKYNVCEAKKKWFVKFKECVARSDWGSDNVFVKCSNSGGAAMCYETKTGENMKVLLRERIWNRARAGKGNILKKSFNFIKKTVWHGVRKEREKTMTSSGNGKLSVKTMIHQPRDETLDYQNVGTCVYESHRRKFYMLNKIPFGPPVDFIPCDMGASLIEVNEANALSVKEQALMDRLETLTAVDLHTEKGMAALKEIGDVLLGIGITLGAIALIGLFFVVKIVAFFIVPILFVGGFFLLVSMV